eukprot:4935010-Prymnesium_polylepis.1
MERGPPTLRTEQLCKSSSPGQRAWMGARGGACPPVAVPKGKANAMAIAGPCSGSESRMFNAHLFDVGP